MAPPRRHKPSKDDPTLFGSEPTAARTPKVKKRHLEAVEISAQARIGLDGAPLYLSSNDSLLLRGVQPHSAKKAEQVFRGIDTVSVAMSRQPFAVQYVELYSGPGVLLDEMNSKEVPGSPLQSLAVRRPFDQYVFSDLSEQCIDALDRRVGHRSNVSIMHGDANDLAHIDRIVDQLDPRALTIIYLDPAKPSHLLFETVRYLAYRLRFVDLIINLPLHGLRRGILGAGAGYENAGAAGRFLGHPQPSTFLRGETVDLEAVRGFYDEQLIELGFLPPARRTISFVGGSPYYDILYASRHPTGIKLWNKTNPIQISPQMSLITGELAG
jgi:three-Cys-motif partner protein